jgi:hypothetical protein
MFVQSAKVTYVNNVMKKHLVQTYKMHDSVHFDLLPVITMLYKDTNIFFFQVALLFNATFLVFVPTVVLIFSYRIIVFCSVNDCMSNNSVHINLLPAMFFFRLLCYLTLLSCYSGLPLC